ncbi:hypothetical protein [Hymenobacter terrigena]
MATPLEKRRNIFKFFSRHLNFLKANGFLKGTHLQYDETYICPVCLRQFSERDLEDSAPNMLTIEHAPPAVSGGKGVVLTCKECNSVAGMQIDFHLIKRLQEAELRNLVPNISGQVRVTSGDLTIQGDIEVGPDNVITLKHNLARNHPGRLDSFVDRVGPRTNPLINLDFGKIQTDAHRMQVGLLKTAYILAFAKFGYSFLLDEVYDSVRKQLLEPGANIYPKGFWHKDHNLLEYHEGVHLCTTPIVEGIHCIFPIKTTVAAHYFGVHLPIPLTSTEAMVTALRSLGPGSKLSDSFTLQPMEKKDDFFFDLEKIHSIHDWFFKVRMTKILLNDPRPLSVALHLLRYPHPKSYAWRPIRFLDLNKTRVFTPRP